MPAYTTSARASGGWCGGRSWRRPLGPGASPRAGRPSGHAGLLARNAVAYARGRGSGCPPRSKWEHAARGARNAPGPSAWGDVARHRRPPPGEHVAGHVPGPEHARGRLPLHLARRRIRRDRARASRTWAATCGSGRRTGSGRTPDPGPAVPPRRAQREGAARRLVPLPRVLLPRLPGLRAQPFDAGDGAVPRGVPAGQGSPAFMTNAIENRRSRGMPKSMRRARAWRGRSPFAALAAFGVMLALAACAAGPDAQADGGARARAGGRAICTRTRSGATATTTPR